MKNKKSKIIAFVLVFALIVSSLLVTAIANTKETKIEVITNKTQIATGETATVSVKLTTNYSVATMSIPVFYDKTLVTVSNANANLSGYSVAETTLDSQSVNNEKVFANTGLDSSKYGFVLVTYIGGANAQLASTINGTVLTFNITAKEDITGKAAIKVVGESIKDSENVAGMLYFGYSSSGKIDSIPELVDTVDVTKANAQVDVVTGSVELLPVTGQTSVVDKENGLIYGIEAGTTNFNELFTVSNGGSFELVANASGYTNGTGAKIIVKNSSGTQVAEYTMIIFGDVNGDGAISDTDTATVSNASLGGTIEGDANNIAADVNGDGGVSDTDSATISNAALGGAIKVNPYA